MLRKLRPDGLPHAHSRTPVAHFGNSRSSPWLPQNIQNVEYIASRWAPAHTSKPELSAKEAQGLSWALLRGHEDHPGLSRIPTAHSFPSPNSRSVSFHGIPQKCPKSQSVRKVRATSHGQVTCKPIRKCCIPVMHDDVMHKCYPYVTHKWRRG